MIKARVGIEAEFFLLNAKDEAIVVPAHWDRDDFPVLGEIRGEPGRNIAETIANFYKKKLEIEDKVRKGQRISMEAIKRIRLKMYQEAMRQMRGNDKFENVSKIRNIYGTDISEWSDQILKDRKIQGVNASCGLHIHFSCAEIDEYKVELPVYEPVTIPYKLNFPLSDETDAALAKMLMEPKLYLNLYRREGYKKEKVLQASASQLNRPTVEWIVGQMDKAFFDKFAPAEKDRTKYRQPGFYELKEHGFEYRSLPATEETINALPEIVSKAFDLLKHLNKWDD